MKENFKKIKIKLYKMGKVGWCGGQIYYKLYICDNIKSFRVNWLGKTKNLMRLFKTKKGHGN